MMPTTGKRCNLKVPEQLSKNKQNILKKTIVNTFYFNTVTHQKGFLYTSTFFSPNF